jgi:hypothetical protein
MVYLIPQQDPHQTFRQDYPGRNCARIQDTAPGIYPAGIKQTQDLENAGR